MNNNIKNIKLINVISACCNSGQQKAGVALGPRLIYNSINQIYLDRSFIINHHYKIEQPEFNNDGYEKLYDLHMKSNDEFTLVLGGDHSIGQSSVAGSLTKYNDDLLVIWIDAHPDLNTHKTSLSKNTHGMPVSGLLGLEPLWINRQVPKLKPENLIYFGIRDIDDAEIEFINKLNIKYFLKMNDILSYLESMDLTNRKIHISFDIDSLDPYYISSTGTIANNGLYPTEIIIVYKYLLRVSNIVALDIVELNPELGDINKTMDTINFLLKSFIN
jgi:arginase